VFSTTFVKRMLQVGLVSNPTVLLISSIVSLLWIRKSMPHGCGIGLPDRKRTCPTWHLDPLIGEQTAPGLQQRGIEHAKEVQ
jgi:hypothetical protein